MNASAAKILSVPPDGHVDAATWALYAISQVSVTAMHTYRSSRDFLLQTYTPIEPYCKVFSILWTVVLLCNAARQVMLVASRRRGLPKPAVEGQSRRIKLAIPLSWWLSVHFVVKPKKNGHMVKSGVSFNNIKFLLVIERSKSSALSVKRQVKCYGGVSMLKFSTSVVR